MPLACLCLAQAGLTGASRDGAGGADQGLRQAFERARYSLRDAGHGTWQGVNAAQRLTLEFNPRETRLTHPDGSVTFHLTGFGYGDRLHQPAPARVTGSGNRVEFLRGDLAEWYVNGPQGLEQGFTLVQRPATDQDGEPLVIALGVSGGLLPAQKTGGGPVLFASDHGVVLRYAGLKAVDARGRVLPSRLAVRDREIRLLVEDRDARYPLVVDPAWTQQQELTASDGQAGDRFGYSVAVNANTAVVGAYCKGGCHGAAYVFVQSGGVWTQQQELTASDGQAGDYFGSSVSVDGDTAVIGAPTRTTCPATGRYQGAAYVFVRSGGAWTQQQELTSSDCAAGQDFGATVSVSGDTAVIGASGSTVNLNSNQGAAYVFVRSGAAWSRQQKLTAGNGAAGHFFGSSVALSGNTAVIGADGVSNFQGAAYEFARTGGAWSQLQELTVSDGAAGDYFGISAALSGNTAAIGAYGRNSYQGAAYVFTAGAAGAWTQQAGLTASDGVARDCFGISVAVSGTTAVIGAHGRKSGQGAAYLFAGGATGAWSLQQELTASDPVPGAAFGLSVSASGLSVLAGASNAFGPGESEYRGTAYAFASSPLAAQTIAFGPLANQAFGAAPFTVSASASSGLPVSLNSQTTFICTVSGSQVTLVGAGWCIIQAAQAGNANYAPATPVSQIFQVTPGSQSIAFAALADQTLDAAPFTLHAAASSGLPVSFSSQTTAVCTVSGSQVTLVAAGTCTIRAAQAGNANYAAAAPVNQSFTVKPPAPLPTVTLVAGAGAFGGFSAVAQGSWVEIYGSNLAMTTRSWNDADFSGNSAPTLLDGVQVTIGGQAAFIGYLSPGQVNAQVPSGVGSGSQPLTLSIGGLLSAPVNLTVNATQPGLLAPASFKIGGIQYVVAQLPDGTYVLPAGSIAGVNSRPAQPGETIVVYGIGFGPVVPGIPAGQVAAGFNRLTAPLQFLFGQTPAAGLTYAGLAPNSVGLYQFNIVVPPVPDGDLVPLTFSLGGVSGTQTLYTAVHR